MPAVEKDHNSRAKEHDQNTSFFFFINYRVIVQRYIFLTAQFSFQVGQETNRELVFGGQNVVNKEEKGARQ